MDGFQKAIFKTLIYADIFDYPLSAEEVLRFLIASRNIKPSSVQKALSLINADLKLIETEDDFYFLKGRGEIVELRKKREKISLKKLEIAKKVAKKLKLIPTIKLIGVTGALAMRNSEEDDDIDFLIITSKNRLWLTRILALLLIEVLGKRRKPDDPNVKDKICPNIFLDENHLALPKKERNLFTAHEICQMKVLWEKDNTYKKFLWENRWVKEFLPNAIPNFKFKIVSCKFSFKILNFVFDFLEKLAFKIQFAYMRPKMTKEKVAEGFAFFHPKDVSRRVLEKYVRKSIKMGLNYEL